MQTIILPGAVRGKDCRQGLLGCGDNIIGAILKMASKTKKNKRSLLGLMTPAQMERKLRARGIESRRQSLGQTSKEGRAFSIIEGHLQEGKPVILVVAARMHRRLPRWMGHYVLLLGWESATDSYLVYDPSREVTPEPLPAGNTRWSREELLSAWKAGWGDLPGLLRALSGRGKMEILVPAI